MKIAMTMMDDDVHACRYDDDDIFSCTCNHVSIIMRSYPVGPLIIGPQQKVSRRGLIHSSSDWADPAVSWVLCLFRSLPSQLHDIVLQLPLVLWC